MGCGGIVLNDVDNFGTVLDFGIALVDKRGYGSKALVHILHRTDGLVGHNANLGYNGGRGVDVGLEGLVHLLGIVGSIGHAAEHFGNGVEELGSTLNLWSGHNVDPMNGFYKCFGLNVYVLGNLTEMVVVGFVNEHLSSYERTDELTVEHDGGCKIHKTCVAYVGLS